MALLQRLMHLFPALADDEPRCAAILRELEKVSRDAAVRAIDEYMTLDESLLHMTRLMAIAYRHDRQEQERIDAAAKAQARADALDGYARHSDHLKAADSIIADMTDEDVQREWAPILALMTGKAREWAEKWPMEKVRTNIQLKLRIAELAGAR